MERHWVFTPLLLAVFLNACSREAATDSISSPSYSLWSESTVRQTTMADARGTAINICLTGSVSDADLQRSKDWSRRAVLTWLRALKVRDDQVTSDVAFTCDNKHLTINLRNGGGTSFASPSVATIYMTRPYGTWTHELGHALAGLSDTYAGGAGSCQSGQPLSLMCWGAYGPRANPDEFSTMWPDDIAGVNVNQDRLFADSTPPEWGSQVDLEAPLIAEAPWPEATAEVFGGDDQMQVELVGGGATAIISDGRLNGSIDL